MSYKWSFIGQMNLKDDDEYGLNSNEKSQMTRICETKYNYEDSHNQT